LLCKYQPVPSTPSPTYNTAISFPRFTANRNDGRLLSDPGALLVARNTLHFGAFTHVSLPIVALASLPANVPK
jgi:hypothetical protein